MRNNVMNIVQMYAAIKDAAIDSKFINDVKLVKDAKDIDDIVNSGNYRTLIIVPSVVNLYKNDNDIVFKLIVIDKTDEEDTSFLHSINDGIALIRLIVDYITENFSNRTEVGEINIDSGIINNNSLLTAIDTSISFEFNLIL